MSYKRGTSAGEHKALSLVMDVTILSMRRYLVEDIAIASSVYSLILL
jgi:hypothetical protein